MHTEMQLFIEVMYVWKSVVQTQFYFFIWQGGTEKERKKNLTSTKENEEHLMLQICRCMYRNI